jgi:hypothetical protein
VSIWQFNNTLSQRLLRWNVVNGAAGLILFAASGRYPYRRALGSQAAGWAAVNIGIALAGRTLTARRFANEAQPYAADVVAGEAQSLRRLLWVNTVVMDPLYIVGGWWLARTRADNPRWRGAGHGIALQGVLLLIFDLIHVLAVPDTKRA